MPSFQLVTLNIHVITRVVLSMWWKENLYLGHKWFDLVLCVRYQGRHLGHEVFHGLLAHLFQSVVLHKRLEVFSEILVVKLENSRGVKICKIATEKERYMRALGRYLWMLLLFKWTVGGSRFSNSNLEFGATYDCSAPSLGSLQVRLATSVEPWRQPPYL